MFRAVVSFSVGGIAQTHLRHVVLSQSLFKEVELPLYAVVSSLAHPRLVQNLVVLPSLQYLAVQLLHLRLHQQVLRQVDRKLLVVR